MASLTTCEEKIYQNSNKERTFLVCKCVRVRLLLLLLLIYLFIYLQPLVWQYATKIQKYLKKQNIASYKSKILNRLFDRSSGYIS